MSFDYRFCPQCATPLVEQHNAGRVRIACPAPDCGFVHWNNPLPGGEPSLADEVAVTADLYLVKAKA
jgi:ribosomal protein S27AE